MQHLQLQGERIRKRLSHLLSVAADVVLAQLEELSICVG